MKSILTLALISITAFAFCQPIDHLTPGVKQIILSKGESLTIKEHKEFIKQAMPIVRMYFKRDSVYQKFLSNTVSPYLYPGDTIQDFEITEKEILITLKPKKK